MIFTYDEQKSYKYTFPKYVKIEKYIYTGSSVQKFIDELISTDLYDQLDKSINSDPQINYEIFSRLVKLAREKCLPKRTVKYNKRKHKNSKWMTDGILKSINTKDKLYKILIQTNVVNTAIFNTLKEEFKVYRATLRRSIREAKRRYYIKTFNMYKNDIKITRYICRTW